MFKSAAIPSQSASNSHISRFYPITTRVSSARLGLLGGSYATEMPKMSARHCVPEDDLMTHGLAPKWL